MSTGRTYLVRFAQIKEDFRLAELRAICDAEGIVFPEKESASYSAAVSVPPYGCSSILTGETTISVALLAGVL